MKCIAGCAVLIELDAKTGSADGGRTSGRYGGFQGIENRDESASTIQEASDRELEEEFGGDMEAAAEAGAKLETRRQKLQTRN